MRSRSAVAGILALAATALVAVSACSDAGESPVAPAIPTISDGLEQPTAAVLPGITPNATCPCTNWSCWYGDCGYEPSTDGRGACCTSYDCSPGADPVAKPSCTVGGGCSPASACQGVSCEEQPGACQWFQDVCTDPVYNPWGCMWLGGIPWPIECPAECTCCYYG